jgi:aminoglycoside phosphotransferase family enzyme
MNTNSQPEYIDFLLNPANYPHPAESPELVQTHISYVILAGNFVYKWKKDVNFGFLDFSTQTRRKHFCEEEVRLNSRLCPDVYLETTWVSKKEDRKSVV